MPPPAWSHLLRAHSSLMRRLSADLVSEHGLTINDFEVLLHLSFAPERMMRRVDLAASVLLTPSGITRLLDGLERAGYVGRAACKTDRRVVYATLTDAGFEKLKAARTTHLLGVDRLVTQQFDAEELETLGALLARLVTMPADDACGPDGD